MGFDLSNLPTSASACEAGYTFEPRYPDGSGIGATITIFGPDSAKARAFASRRFAEIQQRETAARKQGREPDPLRADELEAQSVEMAAAYTAGWAGFSEAGQPLEATEANFRKVYTQHPWLRSQVIAQAQDLGNFLRPPSASLLPTPRPSSSLT